MLITKFSLQNQLNACRMELNKSLARDTPPPMAIKQNIADDYDGDGIVEGVNEGKRPEALSDPRAGIADDLKQIKGIGLKMEKMCHSLGFYHFDQIASWNRDEIAWVDANLQGFKGRVTRDEWVSQAKVLAAGDTTVFAQKVSEGNMNY